MGAQDLSSKSFPNKSINKHVLKCGFPFTLAVFTVERRKLYTYLIDLIGVFLKWSKIRVELDSGTLFHA